MLKVNRVWSKFSRKTIDGAILKFRIEDVPENRIADVVELCMKFFAKEESLHRAAGVPKSETAMRESREILWKLLITKPHHIVACCIDDETDKEADYIGASLMNLVRKEDTLEEIKPETPEMEKFFDIIERLMRKYDALEDSRLDCFYDDRGVVVHSNYRGLGIAREFFRVRRLICKEHQIPMTGAWMTSAGSQKAAERDGWKTVCELDYEEIGQLWDTIFSVPDLMSKYGIKYLCDVKVMTTHPEYRSLGVAQKLTTSRRMVCIEQGLRITGAWITSYGSQKTTARDGWVSILEITRELVGKRLGITIKKGPATLRYMIAVVSVEDKMKNIINHKIKCK